MLTMKPKQAKLTKQRPATKRAAKRKEPQTLAELNAWFAANKELVLARAKANTKRLTGREML